GEGLPALWSALEAEYRDAEDWRLHYVTAWEMYERIRAVALGDALEEAA
ncbi:MAG: hypothetical protein GWN53_13905, partial [Gammaproteobacteria bacterium]|nr:hypothetical protein [Gammaproteobacteria bacterium]NIV52946.1 hypothetical protein [Gammaproteobacteria bacterium]